VKEEVGQGGMQKTYFPHPPPQTLLKEEIFILMLMTKCYFFEQFP
jgi:hypothetical protein